jgi:hypothetical protein
MTQPWRALEPVSSPSTGVDQASLRPGKHSVTIEMHRKANPHPAVFGSERQFRLTVQDLDLIFGGKVA